jgi:hypothetical protein
MRSPAVSSTSARDPSGPLNQAQTASTSEPLRARSCSQPALSVRAASIAVTLSLNRRGQYFSMAGSFRAMKRSSGHYRKSEPDTIRAYRGDLAQLAEHPGAPP